MKKYHRDVFVINNGCTTRTIRLESDTPIDAYGALNAAVKHMEEIAPGKSPQQLKVYCGEAK